MWSEQNPKMICEFFGHSGFFLWWKYFFDNVSFFSIGWKSRNPDKTLPAATSARGRIILPFQTASAED
jgi:hypothetical protein